MESVNSTKNLLDENIVVSIEDTPPPTKVPPSPLPTPAHFDIQRFRNLGSVPHLLHWLLGLPLAIAMVLVPLLLVQIPLIHGGYSFFALTPPSEPVWWVETLRVVLLVGMTYLAHNLANLVMTGVTYAVFRLGRQNGEVSLLVRRRVKKWLELRKWWALAWAACTLAIGAKVLYPLPHITINTNALTQQENATAQLWTEQVIAYMTRSPQFFVTRVCYAIAVIISFLVLEKCIVQQIAIYYHATALGERIADNDFGLRVVRRLRSDVSRQHGPVPLDENGDPLTGPFLWKHLAPGETMRVADLQGWLPAAEAERLWTLLDETETGDLNQADFIRAIDRLYGDRESLDRSISDQTRVIGQLDQILMGLFMFIGILLALAILDVSLKMILSFLTATIGSLVFIFGGTIKKVSESIVFVIFTHPYDVDDRIILSDTGYLVKEIGIWTTTLSGPGGRLTYINNCQIKGEGIVNLRRSPSMSEKVVVSVRPSVERAAIDRMDAMMSEWVQENRRDYLGYCLKGIQVVDREHMEIEFTLEHRTNFQDGGLKDKRTRQFMFKLKEVLNACGIGLSPSFTGGGSSAT